jgi:hypothetical protein
MWLLAMLKMFKWPELKHINQQSRHVLLCLLALCSWSPANSSVVLLTTVKCVAKLCILSQ